MRRAFTSLLAAALLIHPTGCQTGAQERPGGAKALDITSLRKEIELTARLREQEQKSKVSANQSSFEEQIFEESIKLEAEGSVYHPNFMEFSLGALFGLMQYDYEESYDHRTRTSNDDGDRIEFDFEGDFLKKKPYPGTVYAQRHEFLEPRPFLSSLLNTTTNYGLVWQYVDPKMPTNLQFNHVEVDLDPLDDREEDGYMENTLFRFDTAYKFSDHNQLSFFYEYQKVKEEPFGLDYDSDELSLAHRLDFGEGYRHRLESELDYFNQEGTFDVERTRWREILRLTHTDSLRSWYQFEYLNRDQGNLAGVPPIKEESLYLSGTLEHRWYESLVSQLFGFAQRQDYESGLEIERYGIQPSLDYRKKNAWGVLLADYRFRFQHETRDGGTLDAQAIDERVTFRDPDPVVLSNPNVVPSSIFMTAEDRLTVYQAGRDYRVRETGDRTELERVPTGQILDGQSVLVDYVFVLGGDFDLDTTQHTFGLRQDFKFGLSPYYRFRRQEQDITPRTATGITPEDITAHIVGTEFDRWGFRALAEYEDHDSNVNPFRAVRLGADYTHRFDFNATGKLRTRWTDMNQFGVDERRTKFLTVEGRWRQTIRGTLTLEGAVLYRTEDDSLTGDDEGVDVDLSLEWLIRDTELRVTYEYGQFEDDFAEQDNQALFVRFRRKF